MIRMMEIGWLPYAVMHAFCNNRVAARLAVTGYGTRLPSIRGSVRKVDEYTNSWKGQVHCVCFTGHDHCLLQKCPGRCRFSVQ